MDMLSTKAFTLDGNWLIGIDPENIGRQEKWFSCPQPGAKPTLVPKIIQDAFPEYHGVAWYWRSFNCPVNSAASGRVILKFHCVDYIADVWVNDVYVGSHEGGECPFDLDITDCAILGGQNRLAVRVLNPTNEPIDGVVLSETPHLCRIIPYSNGACFNIGGILESVELMLYPQVRITDIYANPDCKTGIIHIQATVINSGTDSLTCKVQFVAAPAIRGDDSNLCKFEQVIPAGESTIETVIRINEPKLWDLEDPFLYRITVRMCLPDDSIEERSVRCGFKDFQVENGYFRLNGKRILLKGTHTINHCPGGGISFPNADIDLLRRDLIYAKTLGFNMIRFIAQAAHPYQLDLCDEIGLMVYEESRASWCLADSEHMSRRYDLSYTEMIIRDRNHPSIAIWGLLNETRNTPTYQHAKASLPLIRKLDNTRLVLLGSGRWDTELGTGSVSNPGSSEWEYVWGAEKPCGETAQFHPMVGICGEFAGDIHFYPIVPPSITSDNFIRNLGKDTKPIFLSEYGIGSTMNVIREWRKCIEAGINPNTEDVILLKQMSDRYVADWNRLGFDGIYAFPEDMLQHSQALSSRWRTQCFNLVRSNPNICGYNLTGMLDHVMTGEGLWTYWREWKPGIADAVSDGWAPLRWCLFVSPTHVYSGREFEVEAIVASEDVLKPGDYPVCLKITGAAGVVWEHKSTLHIPETRAGEDAPLTWQIMRENITLNVPEGKYKLHASMENAAPCAGCISFYVSESANYPKVESAVTLWGIDSKTETWLHLQGVNTTKFEDPAHDNREVILIGDSIELADDTNGWIELARRIAQGSTAVFISPKAFIRKIDQQEPDPVGWLPLENKGRCYDFHDWLYHKETVGKYHPIFKGLPSKSILDWDYYGQVISHTIMEGQDTPDDTAAAAFAAGYCNGTATNTGYECGTVICSYNFGSGRFIINALSILDNLDKNPAADKLLLNLINHAAESIQLPLSALPADFDDTLKKIGYTEWTDCHSERSEESSSPMLFFPDKE